MTCPGRVIYLISRGTGAFIVKAPSLEPIFNHLDISDVIYGLFGKRGIFVSDGTNWYEVYGDFSSAA
jgi:hypothetical protein